MRRSSPLVVQVTGLLPSTSNGDPSPFWMDLHAAAYLALLHFNSRNATVVPSLADSRCNVQLSYRAYDSEFSVFAALKKLSNEILYHPHTEKPLAVLGAMRSAVSRPVSILAGAAETMTVSPTSTSALLDNTDSFPYFTRLIPTNRGDAKALVRYYDSLGITHFGVIYIQDGFGDPFFADVLTEAKAKRIQVFGFGYNGDTDSLRKALDNLKRSGARYIFGIPEPGEYDFLVREIYSADLMNTENVWIFADSASPLTSRELFFEDQDMANAVQGVGVLLADPPLNPKLVDSFAEFRSEPGMLQGFYDIHDEPIYESFNLSSQDPTMVQFSHFYYDSMMSIGMAACELEKSGYNFTSKGLYREFVGLEYEASSGFVHFDDMGTRQADSVRFTLFNVQVDLDSNSSRIPAKAVESVYIYADGMDQVSPFFYFDGSAIPPLFAPPNEVTHISVSPAICAVGLVMACVIIVMSVGWGYFTHKYRNKRAIKSAQPEFLYMTCVGCILMACSVFPNAFVEKAGACMSVLWLFSAGFVTLFCALACKMHRLNKLMSTAQTFRRITVKAKDVIGPFLFLISLNFIVLGVWSAIDPLVYTHNEVNSVDRFGRVTATYGSCSSKSPANQMIFMSVWFLINVVALIFSNYESYQARNQPTHYNEGFYICVANFFLFEGVLFGVPLLFMVNSDPSALFLVQSVLTTVICLSTMLPVFMPKYWRRRKGRRKTIRRITSNGDNSSSQFSRGFSLSFSSLRSFGLRSSAPPINVNGEGAIGNASSLCGSQHEREESGKMDVGSRTVNDSLPSFLASNSPNKNLTSESWRLRKSVTFQEP